ncbi:MAG: glycoside hydrolase family 3 protein, partial [Bacteroidia bacterium]
AKETKGCGFNWTFSPCAAIPFNEKWGRVYEAFSENTTLTQNLVAASITGLQGKLGSKGTIMATAKHFIGDGATDYGIEGGNTTVSKQLYNDILLPPYKTAIEHNVGAIMASFNNQHGINMHAHKALITDSLKNKYGFKGIVISDWKGYSRFGKSDVINAGLDMVMAVDGDLDLFQSEMKTFVDDGTVSIDRINDAVRRILIQKIKLGLFKNPYPESTYVKSIGSKAHRKLAKQAVSESLVLLKNDQALPLKPKSKIVIVGQHANNLGLQSGGWTISWQGKPENYPGGTTILQGFNALNNFEIVYDTFGSLAIYDADYAIVCVGEKPYAEFFGDVGHEQSDCELTLDSAQQQYINNYANKGPKLITVLVSGRPMVVTNQIDKSDAFVAAWLPGSEGDGIAEVLSGNSDFKGKLPHTWPKSLDNFKGLYGPNYWNKENIGLFELGYGLSYK